ncbi:MAG: AAA family ATPase, partial [Thiogranum sp.]
MLHKYRFKNFFSFVSETEVSFLLNHQVPATDLVFESPGGARLSKVVAAIGPNASGKTNVLKPLAFLSWFVAHSFTASKPEGEIPIQPHFFSDDKDSEFEIEFENQGQHYRYSL